MTLEDLRQSGQIVYEYVRGSHAYGLNTETSDKDIGGVFVCPMEQLFGLRSKYVEQVSDDKSDVVFYEFGRWIELLIKGNPTALESLFIPERCIVQKPDSVIQSIIDHREMFLSKECFKMLAGYAASQIGKARGLNKKIVNPIVERKGLLDFCYVPYRQGSKKLIDWLNDNGLKQKYCGLVALPNMHDTYGLYYDWGTHLICEYGADLKGKKNLNDVWDVLCEEQNLFYDDSNHITGTKCFTDHLEKVIAKYSSPFDDELKGLYEIQPYGFTGIVSETGESNEVRVCNVPKYLEPLTYMTYNKSGYESHCRDYKEYKEWEEKRNPIRYESNLDKNYDSKNMCHCMRLLRMGVELAEGKGFNIDRTDIDRDFLLSIKRHEIEYDELMKMVEEEKKKMDIAIPNSTLPEKIDLNTINHTLLNGRLYYYIDKWII